MQIVYDNDPSDDGLKGVVTTSVFGSGESEYSGVPSTSWYRDWYEILPPDRLVKFAEAKSSKYKGEYKNIEPTLIERRDQFPEGFFNVLIWNPAYEIRYIYEICK